MTDDYIDFLILTDCDHVPKSADLVSQSINLLVYKMLFWKAWWQMWNKAEELYQREGLMTQDYFIFGFLQLLLANLFIFIHF